MPVKPWSALNALSVHSTQVMRPGPSVRGASRRGWARPRQGCPSRRRIPLCAALATSPKHKLPLIHRLDHGVGSGTPGTTVAATGGDKDAVKGRDMVAALMTPAQIAEAQKLAREWKPTTIK